MKRFFRLGQVILAVLFVLSFALQGAGPAAAQDGGVRTQRHPGTGKLSFVGAAPGRPIRVQAAQARGLQQQDRALAMIQPYAADFGLKQPGRELKVRKTQAAPGRQITRFQQTYQDIPVLAGELVVDATDSGDLLSINGEISPDLSLGTAPAIDARTARDTAIEMLAKWRNGKPADYQASEPELWIYDARLLEPDGTPPALVWRMDITSTRGEALDELVLVDAQRGSIALHFNQVDVLDAAARKPAPARPASVASSPASTSGIDVRTYSMNGSEDDNLLPGTLRCSDPAGGCTGGSDPDVDHAELYADDFLQFLNNRFGRNSLDGAGGPVTLSVHYGVNYDNSFWYMGQAIFADGWTTDDVVAHELTHGLTEHTSDLFYYYESGAINESLSDIFGELYDQANGLGTDTVGVQWLMGEELPGGAVRSLKDPTLYGDPDSTMSYWYDADADMTDNGGVHHNSGVNNKAAYWLINGGGPVVAIGADKTLAIYYEANAHVLTSGASFQDLAADLYQACLNLVGGAQGITLTDCDSVTQATDGVQMDVAPPAVPHHYDREAPVCDTGSVPLNLFFDGFENGTGGWSLSSTRWKLNPSYADFVKTGRHSLYMDDYPAARTDTNAAMRTAITIPPNAYLRFNHAYDFEHYNIYDSAGYDGGVVEYQVGTGKWTDAASLMDYDPYPPGYIYSGYGNPLGGRYGYIGVSGGYVSTRLNLSSLAGKNVRFRWRVGLDNIGYSWGWWLDDIRIYTCESTSIPNATVAIAGAPVGSYYVQSTTGGLHQYAGVQTGPVQVHTNMPMVTSQRGYMGPYSTFNEVMGIPNNQLTNHYWFPWYDSSDNTKMITWVLVGNPSTTQTAYVTYKIAGQTMMTVAIPPFGNYPAYFDKVVGGPVEVTSNINVFASERALVGWPAGSQSFDEVPGFPHNQLTSHYWFTWYDDKDMTTDIMVGNPSTTAAATVTIKIHGVTKETFTLAPTSTHAFHYPGVQDGPVEVLANRTIFASQRGFFGDPGYETFNEVVGYPHTQLTNNYWFPWYDFKNMITWVLVGNPSATQTATVTITIAGQTVYYNSIPPFGNDTPVFPDVVNGPVQVTSNIPIFTSERVLKGYPGTGASFNEILGMSNAKLTTDYWFTWYDGKDMTTDLVIGRP